MKLSRALFNTTPSPGKLVDHSFSTCCWWSQLTITLALISRSISAGAFRKSPSGKIDDGRDITGVLVGVEVGDSWDGEIVISMAGTAVAGLTFLPSLEDFVDSFLEVGWKYPLRVFILNDHLVYP